MDRFSKAGKILYPAGALASICSIPIGNAIKDFGVIHTVGIIIALFVCAGLLWELVYKK